MNHIIYLTFFPHFSSLCRISFGLRYFFPLFCDLFFSNFGAGGDQFLPCYVFFSPWQSRVSVPVAGCLGVTRVVSVFPNSERLILVITFCLWTLLKFASQHKTGARQRAPLAYWTDWISPTKYVSNCENSSSSQFLWSFVLIKFDRLNVNGK